jgi:predicted Zn-dependent peptidase
MQSAGDRADRLSMFTTYFGDPELVNAQVDRYRAVTAEQVSKFARERLVPQNRVELVYVPRRGDEAATAVSSAAEGLV